MTREGGGDDAVKSIGCIRGSGQPRLQPSRRPHHAGRFDSNRVDDDHGSAPGVTADDAAKDLVPPLSTTARMETGEGTLNGGAQGGEPPVTTDGPGRPRSKFRLGNRPPLTGFRAFALTTVLVYHSNFRTWPGSWIAIQMFFVLSGFLITSMLAAEGDRKGRISLRSFYARRAARLLPPLALTIVLILIYAALVNVSEASTRVWGDSAAALFYFADYRQAFGHEPFFGYLAQTWSLSIEEQFYVIWSVLMVTSVALHKRALAYGFATFGMLFSVADRLWLADSPSHFTNADFTRIYYAFDTRADALFLGCLLGLLATDGYLNEWSRGLRKVLGAAAVASVGFLIWILYNAPLFQKVMVVWWIPLTTIASAIIIAHFVINSDKWGARIVGLGVFVFLGDLTYTLYLVHWPIYLAIQPNGTHWGYWPTELVRLAIIFAIAIGSWFLIEKPLLRWRQRSAAKAIGPTTAQP
jgi:peptidoglycan/LPS O-acetylase OafA/YrhL